MRVLADARQIPLRDGCVQCVVTSPPYWCLRDYGVPGQIGLEPTPEAYVETLVQVFREVWRVLRDDGTVWLNLGDSYAAARGGTGMPAETLAGGINGHGDDAAHRGRGARDNGNARRDCARYGLKHKDLIGIPWRVAFALQADGWYLRSDIIWAKPNPMPESVTDRPTKAHEYVFLLTKRARYYYNGDAIKNPPAASTLREIAAGYDGTATKDYEAAGVQNPSIVKARIIARKREKQRGHGRRHAEQIALGSNARTVWTIATQPYPGSHFATMPEALAERCIRAGSRPGDLVLDPFGGSGTTVRVARRLNRRGVMLELNPAYLELARERTSQVQVSLLEEETDATT